MNHFIFSSFFLIIILGIVEGQEKSCKAVISDMTKQQMGMMSKCSKTMKFKNAKDKAAKSMCVMKCVMQDVGMLNEEGKTDRETFVKMIAKFFSNPTDQEYILKVLGPCQEKHGPEMDPNEEFCKSYDPFVKCLMGSMLHMCPPAS